MIFHNLSGIYPKTTFTMKKWHSARMKSKLESEVVIVNKNLHCDQKTTGTIYYVLDVILNLLVPQINLSKSCPNYTDIYMTV